MKKTTLNAAQAAYDAQTPPDDAEYEKKEEAFLQRKEKHRERILAHKIDLMIAFYDFDEAIHKGEVDQDLIDKYGDFADDAIKWQSTRLAAKDTGFKENE